MRSQLCTFLVIGLVCALPARGQVIDCATDLWPGFDLAAEAHWGAGYEGGAPCREDVTYRDSLRSEFGVEVRIFVPDNWSVSWHPEVPRDIVTWVADAVRTTMRALQPTFPPVDVNVILLEAVFTSSRTEMDFGVFARTAAVLDPCPVSMPIVGIVERSGDRRAGTQRERDVQATISHELFHCYQTHHFADRLVADSGVRWWVESTAEFVAQKLYPCNRSSISHGMAYTPDAPVFEQHYPNFLFFEHLAGRHGFDLASLAEFMESMPTSPGVERQRQAIAARPNVEDQWHSFARAVLDRELSDCIAPTIEPPVTVLRESRSDSASAQPFAATYRELRFTQNASYKMWIRDDTGAPHSGSSGPNRVSYRLGTTWESPEINGDPIAIDTKCGDEESYLLVWTSTNADEEPYWLSIDVEREPGPGVCCPEIEERDQCVTGTWTLDTDAMLRLLSEINPRVVWSTPEGELRTEFAEDGQIAGTDANLLFRGRIQLTVGGEAPFSVGISGQGAGRWWTEGGRVLHTCATQNEERVVSRVEFPNLPPDSRVFRPGAPNTLARAYTCNQDSLVLDLPGGRMKQIFRRVTP